MTIIMNFYDTNFNFFKKNIQNGSHMIQKIVSNLVAKIICELDIQVKSYHKKISVKMQHRVHTALRGFN